MSPGMADVDIITDRGEMAVSNNLVQACGQCIMGVAEQIQPDAWQAKTPDERKTCLDRVAAGVARQLCVPLSSVEYYDGPTYDRGYYDGGGVIHINMDVLVEPDNCLDALDTIVHELRHAFQKRACNYPAVYGISIAQASIWADNFRFYISPDMDYNAYYNQPVEYDARTFAQAVLDLACN